MQFNASYLSVIIYMPHNSSLRQHCDDLDAGEGAPAATPAAKPAAAPAGAPAAILGPSLGGGARALDFCINLFENLVKTLEMYEIINKNKGNWKEIKGNIRHLHAGRSLISPSWGP